MTAQHPDAVRLRRAVLIRAAGARAALTPKDVEEAAVLLRQFADLLVKDGYKNTIRSPFDSLRGLDGWAYPEGYYPYRLAEEIVVILCGTEPKFAKCDEGQRRRVLQMARAVLETCSLTPERVGAPPEMVAEVLAAQRTLSVPKATRHRAA